MKFALIENSIRLQKVAKVLSDGKWHSTMQIIRKANVCAVNSIISELRLNGLSIKCKREKNKWLYQQEKAK